MASLISIVNKAALVAAFSSLVDTFVRPMVAMKEADKVIIFSDPNFNRLNTVNQTNLNSENTPIYTTLNARILYEKNMDSKVENLNKGKMQGVAQNKLYLNQGLVRVKVDAAGYAYMGRVKRVEIDGSMFLVSSVESPHGLFGAEYYTYWLERIQ